MIDGSIELETSRLESLLGPWAQESHYCTVAVWYADTCI
jgi:hypothetical protein